MSHVTVSGAMYADMIRAGAANLGKHIEEVNNLNVFPIPDGDTGENMMLTMQGGVNSCGSLSEDESLSHVAERISGGMLLGARGNSGVILSQFFAGITEGFRNADAADIDTLQRAVSCGVLRAYEAVITPTPGTILTVAKDAGKFAEQSEAETIEDYFSAFIEEAKRSLVRTPELLPVLKEAGVVDSGGAGLVYIVEGMVSFLLGKLPADTLPEKVPTAGTHIINPELFTSDMELEFGYCTELLLRLQTAKTNPETFDLAPLINYLKSIGNSVVAVKTDSIVKLHVHTMTPGKVLAFCQQFGEFLTVKIENMMLQHNEILSENEKEIPADANPVRERHPFGVVTVAPGEGICNAFRELGAEEVIFGGQTMNPSAEDFLDAFARLNADTVFVLPNNPNILLAARQAAGMCTDSDVRVIPTKTVGDAYAVLSMLDFDSADADTIEREMNEAMADVLTAEVSRSVRDAEMNGVAVRKGDFISFIGKEIIASGASREEVACRALDQMDPDAHALLLLIRGKEADAGSAETIRAYLQKNYPSAEVVESDGGQDIYDYILVAE